MMARALWERTWEELKWHKERRPLTPFERAAMWSWHQHNPGHEYEDKSCEWCAEIREERRRLDREMGIVRAGDLFEKGNCDVPKGPCACGATH